MRSGPASLDEESEAKTSIRRTRRRTPTSPRLRTSEKQRTKGNKVNEHPSTSRSEQPPTHPRSTAGISKKNLELAKPQSANFKGGDDFIPFELSYSSDEDQDFARSGTDHKGKGKATGEEGRLWSREKSGRDTRERDERWRKEDADVTSRRERPSGTSDREWDKGRPQYDRDGHGGRPWPGSQKGGDRERDGDRKRKYRGDDRDWSSGQRLDATSKKCPWMMGVDLEKCHNVAEMLHCEVEAFVDWISPTPVEDEVRGLVVEHIARSIRAPFPDAQVFPFGSYLTKLYLPTGDIDLVIFSDTMAQGDKTKVLRLIATILKHNGITSHVTIIAKARVPIVKFVSTYGRFQVDISLNQYSGLFAGQIITGFLKQMIPSAETKESKALRSLIMITKAFLTQRNLNEVYTGGLGSYSVVCLAVSFLQMHPKIRRGEIDPEKNLGVLVVEFFELYGNYFNYDDVGISLREGGTYFNRRERGWNIDYKRCTLSVEDPADPSNDISSGSYNFHKVKMAFAGAYNLLTTTSYNRVGILKSRHQGTSFRLRQQYEPEDLSVLCTVMGVTQETINHRRLVQELYDNQTLHQILGMEPRVSAVQYTEDREQQPSGNTLDTSPQNPRVVESAWTNGRLNDESECEDDHHRRHSNSYDQDGGRYDIGRQSPKKRQKTHRSGDDAVYLVADKDSKGALSEGELPPEEGGGDASKVHEDDGRGRRQENGMDRHSRREYWLGKAMEIGGVVETSM